METKTGRILIVDDNEDVLFAAEMLLSQHVAEVRTESDPEVLPALLEQQQFDAILLDMNFTQDVTSGQEGIRWLGRILEIDPAAIVILITAYGDVELAVQAIKAGATDFVVKPWQNEKLVATVSSALALSRSRQEVRSLRSRHEQLSADLDQPFQEFVGDSPPLRAVREIIDKVAGTDANVLITGENGTGKELVARRAPAIAAGGRVVRARRHGRAHGQPVRERTLRSRQGRLHGCEVGSAGAVRARFGKHTDAR